MLRFRALPVIETAEESLTKSPMVILVVCSRARQPLAANQNPRCVGPGPSKAL